MSGIIKVGDNLLWDVASWLFRYTTGTLAEQLDDPAFTDSVREIIDNNLNWLNLDDYGPAIRARLDTIIHNDLINLSNASIPEDWRARVADVLEEFVDMTSGRHKPPP